MKPISLVAVVFCVISCSPTLPTYDVKITGNSIKVPVSGFDNSNINIVSDEHGPFDILLVKDSPLAFRSLYLKCTFDAKALDTTPEYIVCPVCGSAYDFDGSATKGPAESPLVKFPTELNPDQTIVTINIQSLGL